MRAVRASGVVHGNGRVELRTEEPVAPGRSHALLVLPEDAEPARPPLNVVEANPRALLALVGCLQLGGDALSDTEALYDHA